MVKNAEKGEASRAIMLIPAAVDKAEQSEPPRASSEVTVPSIRPITVGVLREPVRYPFSFLRYRDGDTWAAQPLPIILPGGEQLREALWLHQNLNQSAPSTLETLQEQVLAAADLEHAPRDFISYTRYTRKQATLSRYRALELEPQEIEGSLEQGQSQETPSLTLGDLDSGRVHRRTMSQRIEVPSDGDETGQGKSPEEVRLEEREKEVEPMTEDKETAGDVEMAQSYPDFEQDSNEHFRVSIEEENASEDSEEVKYMAERRMKSRMLRSITRREAEMARL